MSPSFAQPANGCLPCHGVTGFEVQTADGRVLNLTIDARRYENSVHGRLGCTQCHVNMAVQPHAIAPIGVPASLRPYVDKWRPETQPAAAQCVTCHRPIFGQYEKSIHAQALRRGSTSAPFCADCHGSHYITGVEDLESQVNPQNVPATCASCHAVDLLMSRYNISDKTYETFRQSVHGRKLALGEKDVAVCTSCHGVHDIRSPRDPASTLYPTNIVNTCRKCHRGATAQFATSFRHIAPSPTVEPVVYWIQFTYRWLVVVMVGGMAAYVAIDIYRRLLLWGRRRSGVCG